MKSKIVSFALLTALGCGSAPNSPPAHLRVLPPASSSAQAHELSWTPTPDASFRAQSPTPSAPAAWLAPVPTEHKLSNGLRVLLVHRATLPIVTLQLVAPRGADQQSSPGMGSFLGAMLKQGTTTRSALKLSDDVGSLGAEFSTWVDWDSTNASIKVLPQHLEQGVQLLADVFRNPAFAPEEIQRLQKLRLATIRQEADRPDTLLQNLVARVVFKNHTYGEPLIGTESSIDKITQTSLKQLHQRLVVPSESFLVVVGQADHATLLPLLEKALGDWKGPVVPRRPIALPKSSSRKILVLNRPGASQSQIAVAGVGIDRGSADFHPMLMANTILGGMFSSRLNLNLREAHSYTYGAQTVFSPRKSAGPVFATAAVDTPNTAPALNEILKELRRLKTEPALPKERDLALGRLVGSLPGRFESSQDTADALATLGVFGLPLDEFRTRPAKLQSVQADQVQKLAEKYFDPNRMTVLIVGDLATIRSELEALELGEVIEVDKTGAIVKPVLAAKPRASN